MVYGGVLLVDKGKELWSYRWTLTDNSISSYKQYRYF